MMMMMMTLKEVRPTIVGGQVLQIHTVDDNVQYIEHGEQRTKETQAVDDINSLNSKTWNPRILFNTAEARKP